MVNRISNYLPTNGYDLTLDKIIQFNVDYLTKMITELKPESISPVIGIYGVDKDGKTCHTGVFIEVDFNDSDVKHAVVRELAAKVRNEGMDVRHVCMLSEAWAAPSPTPEPQCMPRDHPERREIVFIAAMSADGTTACRSAELRRRQDNTILVPEFPENDPGMTFESPLLATFYEEYRS